MRALVGFLLVMAAAVVIWLASRAASAPARSLAPREPEAPARERAEGSSAVAIDAAGTHVLAEAEAAPAHSLAPTRETVRALESPEPDAVDAELLLVRVVDRAGSPVADLPLRLVSAPNDDEASLPDELARRTTDARGEARFEGVRTTLETAVHPWRLVHEVAFEQRPEVALDAAALAEECVLSVQPPWCSVEVRVTELDDAPAADGSEVRIEIVSDEEARDPELVRSRPGFDATTSEGRARFPFAEPGRSFEASAAREGSSIRSRSATRASAASGGLARLAVVLGSDHPVISFRAVDERGTPLRDAQLEVKDGGIFSFDGQPRPRTDAHGRFELDIESGWIFSRKSWLLTHERADGAQLLARAKAPEPLDLGFNEGGDVRFAAAPLLVAGRVVDGANRAVAGAEVVAGDQSDSHFFGIADSVRGHSDADGSFELRGILTEEEFEVSARMAGARSDPLRVREGETAARLVVLPLWSVSGRLATDLGIDPAGLELVLVDAAQGERGTSASAEGLFAFGDVRGGTYALACRLQGDELWRRESIAVSGHVDLGEIDLRGLVSRCEIVLVGAEDPGALDGEYAWRPSGSDAEWNEKSFQGERLTILSRAPLIDVRVHPSRYRADSLTGVSGRHELELDPPLLVRIELVTDGALPAPPYVFDPTLMREGVKVGWAESPAYFTDVNRSVLFRVSAPGPARVGWHLERRGASWAVGGYVLTEHEREIVIQDIPGEQRFRIELDADALAQLLSSPPW